MQRFWKFGLLIFWLQIPFLSAISKRSLDLLADTVLVLDKEKTNVIREHIIDPNLPVKSETSWNENSPTKQNQRERVSSGTIFLTLGKERTDGIGSQLLDLNQPAEPEPSWIEDYPTAQRGKINLDASWTENHPLDNQNKQGLLLRAHHITEQQNRRKSSFKAHFDQFAIDDDVMDRRTSKDANHPSYLVRLVGVTESNSPPRTTGLVGDAISEWSMSERSPAAFMSRAPCARETEAEDEANQPASKQQKVALDLCSEFTSWGRVSVRQGRRPAASESHSRHLFSK
ncbi:hypothetical protein PGT21_019770 [Puccinia graminis f. sp. tritici]|uniref:Uncharacterized protein n=1 Tax=Puccinia graminis f. sp. tritici TaxID=56615 RepID=A0A5B0PUJ8_PUCGR|nr:hypothetical protein PGTUg99_033084 [Puccinia graminis f. sp. tritici]KAA1104334.1 hypothetical protein PGT21_019770 [Puccinia graminis f. sp. tritici]